ncbi:PREDICTED: uncharacterized protein LOC106108104 [Papilio polytes]|uniref:uncharacterized protein LOC106108104 n=1 Tax=Papilio polytes TaxID=76194 RepID=UPI000676103C|nr:PREDICTED: uncharacterized protein LOC106108104 [Papilio polytes]
MDQNIIISEPRISKQVYIMLMLNIIGVIATIIFIIILILWALGIILVEPDTSPVIRNYIINFNNKPNVSSIINRAEIMDRFWDLADIQQYPFEDITRGVGFY